MTVKELIEFLSNYPENIPVSMTQCSCDSPLEDDVDIGNVVFIEIGRAHV